MIFGIGNDLAEVERVRAALERPRTGRRFRDRVFTNGEQAYCERAGKLNIRVMPRALRPKKPP